MAEGLVIYGAGGHAKVIVDMAEKSGRRIIAVLDDDPGRRGMLLMGHAVLGGWDRVADLVAGGAARFVVAIGTNRARLAVARRLADAGAAFLPVVHPSAIIASRVDIGAGTVLMAGVVVNPETRIGSHAIVNTGASVDHDCVIGDGVHVAPGCRICGEAAVGDGALLGVGAVVLPGCRVGAGAVVGAGATVTADVADGMVVVGTPARPRGCA